MPLLINLPYKELRTINVLQEPQSIQGAGLLHFPKLYSMFYSQNITLSFLKDVVWVGLLCAAVQFWFQGKLNEKVEKKIKKKLPENKMTLKPVLDSVMQYIRGSYGSINTNVKMLKDFSGPI